MIRGEGGELIGVTGFGEDGKEIGVSGRSMYELVLMERTQYGGR